MALEEKDIPGASLCGRDPSDLKIPELKRWLACRGTPLKGKKADLVTRLVGFKVVFYRNKALIYID